MSTLPSLNEYQLAGGSARRALQESIVSWWFTRLAGLDLRAFAETSRTLASEMKGCGYDIGLIDDVAGSLVVYGVELPKESGITISCTWDAEEGASVACLFAEVCTQVVLAKSPRNRGVVQLPNG
jgi:hypothetical protein